MSLGITRFRMIADRNTTATEIIYDNANLFRNVKKHEKIISQAIKGLVKCILMLGGFDEEQKVSVIFDDGVIEDKTKIRTQDRLDMENGIMKKWEYRMKYYGEQEELAKALVGSE